MHAFLPINGWTIFSGKGWGLTLHGADKPKISPQTKSRSFGYQLDDRFETEIHDQHYHQLRQQFCIHILQACMLLFNMPPILLMRVLSMSQLHQANFPVVAIFRDLPKCAELLENGLSLATSFASLFPVLESSRRNLKS